MFRSIFSVAMMAASVSMAAGNPVPIPAPYARSYVPNGFDSNDVVSFVVEGAFPNSCYRPGIVGARAQQNGHRIEIVSQAFLYSGGMCLDVIMPFDQVVSVGPLEPGVYDITQPTPPHRLGQVVIRAATTTAADDFMYAPITQASFEQRAGGTGEVTLEGTLPLSCLRFKEIRVDVQKTALVVLPIIEKDESRPCVRGDVPFRQTVLVARIPLGRYVLHVRSMNGKAMNQLFDVR